MLHMIILFFTLNKLLKLCNQWIRPNKFLWHQFHLIEIRVNNLSNIKLVDKRKGCDQKNHKLKSDAGQLIISSSISWFLLYVWCWQILTMAIIYSFSFVLLFAQNNRNRSNDSHMFCSFGWVLNKMNSTGE